jgi:hypothetical protein
MVSACCLPEAITGCSLLTVDDDLAESFCVIPSSSSESKQPAASHALQKENETLKAELESTKKRLAAQEHAMKLRMEQDKELRDSIVMAKREVFYGKTSYLLLPLNVYTC